MDNKQIIASELAKVIDSLDQDAILNLLEQPKSSDLGDIAFPAFSLAKVERKAPQAIAADIVEKIDTFQSSSPCPRGCCDWTVCQLFLKQS